MPNNFKAIEGREFQFTTNPIPSLDLDGIMHCKVLELVPHQKLVYSWKAGPGNGTITLDTVVEWTLARYGKGTKLSIKQTGFKEANLSIFNGMTEGWNSHVLKMLGLLNDAK